MIETRFKQTELGLIPEDWEVCKIGDFTDIVTGATPSTENSDYWNGHIRWMNSSELNNKIIFEVHGRISKEGYDSASTHMLPTNCVLIGLAGQGKTRGTAAINKVELCTNQSIGAILPSENIDSDYLYLYMDSQYQNLRTISSGDGGRGGLSKTLLLNFEIVKPNDIGEQKLVAEALHDVDKLICELNTMIEKKRAIMQGAMQELLTARRRLPGFDEPWEEMAFKDFGYTYNGLSGKTGLDFGHGDSKFIMFVNVIYKDTISPNYFEHVNVSKGEKQNKVQKNDLIFNTSSETPDEVGMCSCVTEEYDDLYLNSFCFGFRFYKPNINPRFLTFLLRSKIGRDLMMELAQGSTRYNLPKRKFLSSKIRLPKDIHEQNEIALVLSDMNDEFEEIEVKRDKYIAVRQGMMQQLLTGKIRLI